MSDQGMAQHDVDALLNGDVTKENRKKSGEVKKADMENLVDEAGQAEDVDIESILDIPVTISMEIGHTLISIRNLLQLNQGSVVELDRLAGEPMDVKVNGTLIAHGEVVVVNEKFGIRLTDVVTAAERIRKLR
ncbi:MAG: flagellar motor switch protein FliN [Gammaproteobacteria bacterium]|nr:flagellar motor switch protein FliN [Gammaproteobacteria bacterium]